LKVNTNSTLLTVLGLGAPLYAGGEADGYGCAIDPLKAA
jgi:hypothetical protein